MNVMLSPTRTTLHLSVMLLFYPILPIPVKPSTDIASLQESSSGTSDFLPSSLLIVGPILFLNNRQPRAPGIRHLPLSVLVREGASLISALIRRTARCTRICLGLLHVLGS